MHFIIDAIKNCEWFVISVIVLKYILSKVLEKIPKDDIIFIEIL